MNDDFDAMRGILFAVGVTAGAIVAFQLVVMVWG